VVSLEALSVKGHLALLTHVDSLVVLVPVQGALPAVAALGLGLLHHIISISILLAAAALGHGLPTLTLLHWTSAHNPVIDSIKPLLSRSQAWPPCHDGSLAMDHEDLNDQLSQEVHEGFLLASDVHAQPPGIHSTNAEAPGVDGKPPFTDAVDDPEIVK